MNIDFQEAFRLMRSHFVCSMCCDITVLKESVQFATVFSKKNTTEN